MTIRAHKLLRVRSDGTLGSLFIDKRAVIPVGTWVRARRRRTPGYAYRPGWHAVSDRRQVRHLALMPNRRWFEVELRDVRCEPRPAGQGTWYVAREMRVLGPLT